MQMRKLGCVLAVAVSLLTASAAEAGLLPDRVAALLPQRKEIALDAASLQDYGGEYPFAPGHVLDVTLSGTTLSAQLTGQPAIPVFASAKDKFFYKVVDAQLDFARDAGGEIAAVTLHQNGHDLRAPRVQ